MRKQDGGKMKSLRYIPGMSAGRSSRQYSRVAGTALALMLALTSCQGGKTESREQVEEYHADYDIAMTVRSAADALKVDEPLLASDYDYEGVLTDGEGAPLYTDVQGAPGQWHVQVMSPEALRIHNLFLGDLLPDNLEQYILSTLNLGESDLLTSGTVGRDNDSQTTVAVYRLDGSLLRIETSQAEAPNGVKGPLMNIIVSKHSPRPDEREEPDSTSRAS